MGWRAQRQWAARIDLRFKCQVVLVAAAHSPLRARERHPRLLLGCVVCPCWPLLATLVQRSPPAATLPCAPHTCRQALADGFYGPAQGGVYSPSVQFTVHEMGGRVLDVVPEVGGRVGLGRAGA